MMRGRVAGTAVQRRDFCCENERGFYMNERREEGRGDNDKGGNQKKDERKLEPRVLFALLFTYYLHTANN